MSDTICSDFLPIATSLKLRSSVLQRSQTSVKANKLKFADIEPDWDNPITGDARVSIDENTDAADNDELEQFSDIDADDST